MFILVNESAVVTDKPVSSMILKRVERESAPSFPVASSIIYWPIFSQVQVNGLSGGCLNDGVSWTSFFFSFFFLTKSLNLIDILWVAFLVCIQLLKLVLEFAVQFV